MQLCLSCFVKISRRSYFPSFLSINRSHFCLANLNYIQRTASRTKRPLRRSQTRSPKQRGTPLGNQGYDISHRRNLRCRPELCRVSSVQIENPWATRVLRACFRGSVGLECLQPFYLGQVRQGCERALGNALADWLGVAVLCLSFLSSLVLVLSLAVIVHLLVCLCLLSVPVLGCLCQSSKNVCQQSVRIIVPSLSPLQHQFSFPARGISFLISCFPPSLSFFPYQLLLFFLFFF